ncbi:MAG: OmpA family protein [Alphaproteobacteria bacterium]|nr:OmpA family protein [Alphaproteobacteria bacterium]
MKKSLWFSAALFTALIGVAQPATAQQYLEHYKTTEKPSVEVDLSALGDAPAAQAPQNAPAGATDTPPVPAAPVPAVNEEELMRAATEDVPDKKLDKPFFSTMAPDKAVIAQAKTPEMKMPTHHAVVHAKHRMTVPPIPRHKPRVATISQPSADVPVKTAQAQQHRPSLVTIPYEAPAAPATLSPPASAVPGSSMPMLSLPSRMPALAVDQADMPPFPEQKHPKEEPAPVAAADTMPDIIPQKSPGAAPEATAPKEAAPEAAAPETAAAEPEPAPAEAPPAAMTPPDETVPAAPAPQEAAAPPAEAKDLPVVPTLADLTLVFSGNSSDLSAEAQQKLDMLVGQLNEMTEGRIQVRGFATGEDGSQSSARRISLSRVLSVRSYLMDKGIKPTRVDVRAQGSDTDRSPLDRVDLLFER